MVVCEMLIQIIIVKYGSTLMLRIIHLIFGQIIFLRKVNVAKSLTLVMHRHDKMIKGSFKINLQCCTLEFSSHCIRNTDVYLRPVEGSIAFIYLIENLKSVLANGVENENYAT